MSDAIINTNTRFLKRDDGGYYYVGGVRKTPCNHCGHMFTCEDYGLRNRCLDFMPVFPFQDETGLDRIANTFRVGQAWPTRLIEGQTVGLYNVRSKSLFGHSTVISFHSGSLTDMLFSHGHANHLMLDQPPHQAPAKLYAYLKQNYGPRIINEDTKLTAIYLLRQRRTDAAPDSEG